MKGQGYGGRGSGVMSDLSQIVVLFSSSEGEEDL